MSSNFKMYLNMYQFDTVLPGSKKELRIKPITTGQLKKLLLYETTDDLGKVENALDELIDECVVDEDFDVNDLYLQDRFWLLVELRKITKGNKYTFNTSCDSEKCKSQFVQTVDLSSLPMKPFKLTPKGVEVKVEVPKVSVKVERKRKTAIEEKPAEKKTGDPRIVQLSSGVQVELDLLTRGQQAEAFKIINSLEGPADKKMMELVTITTAEGIKAIITPDGRDIPSFEDKVYLLNNITQEDMDKIQEWYTENDYGLEFKFTVKCPHCQKESEKEIPLEDFFF